MALHVESMLICHRVALHPDLEQRTALWPMLHTQHVPEETTYSVLDLIQA